MMAYCQQDYYWKHFSGFRFYNFLCKKYLWKCRRQNDDHLVSTEIRHLLNYLLMYLIYLNQMTTALIQWNKPVFGIMGLHTCWCMCQIHMPRVNKYFVMTSSNGNIFPRYYWPFKRGIHKSPVNSPHKGQGRGALMFTLICAWINGWVNNGEAGDLRRHRAHYDVTVMFHVWFELTNMTTT